MAPETDPRHPIISSKITTASLKVIKVSPHPLSPNRIYTFLPGTPVLLQLKLATIQYSEEEQVPPSMLRIHPKDYEEVLPDLVKRAGVIYYYLRGETPFPVAPYNLLDEHQALLLRNQVECIGSRRTGPHSPMLVTEQEEETT